MLSWAERDDDVKMNLTLMDLPVVIGRYLLTLRVTDYLDIAIMAFVLYRLFWLVRSTKAASLLKGLFVFLAILALSTALKHQWDQFYHEQHGRLGRVGADYPVSAGDPPDSGADGSRRFIAFFNHTESRSVMDETIGQTVLACTEMSQSRTGALIVFEREILLDDMVRSGTVLDAAVSAEL